MSHFPLHQPTDRPSFAALLSDNSFAPRLARTLTTLTAQAWGMQPLCDDLELVASELVTNAALRAPTIALLLILHPSGEIEIKVWDDAPGEPREQQIDDSSATSGRGLHIVRELSTAWGCTTTPARGKTVWARLGPLPRDVTDDS
ncbi:ATP-binding protein [Actinomadura macrotermitis]|uniref:Histidine kinase/HSP90-like ATPase domain-containing protein n=1 Tax=Actinomadura macrotermitis TaxID=2585200 RepID=A0A7K0BYI8_9ACTN|nr:ATP-binding protein [Actinomadura macrotermitis]MQY06243.1 hypothetical protein [Actinomadura macrotermitis]